MHGEYYTRTHTRARAYILYERHSAGCLPRSDSPRRVSACARARVCVCGKKPIPFVAISPRRSTETESNCRRRRRRRRPVTRLHRPYHTYITRTRRAAAAAEAVERDSRCERAAKVCRHTAARYRRRGVVPRALIYHTKPMKLTTVVVVVVSLIPSLYCTGACTYYNVIAECHYCHLYSACDLLRAVSSPAALASAPLDGRRARPRRISVRNISRKIRAI